MTERRRFEAVVAVRDQTAGPLAAIRARLAGLTQGGAIGRIASVARPALAGLGAAAGVAASAASSLAAAFPPLAALLAGGGVAAMVTMTRSVADASQELAKASRATRIAANELQVLRDAARQAGAGPEQLTAGLNHLRDAMRDAVRGKNNDLLALFRALRIPLRDARGALRSVEDVLPSLAQAFLRNQDAALRARIATALFGESGAALIPMLERGRVAFGDNIARLQALGRQMSGPERQNLAAFSAAWDSLEIAVRGVREAIAVRLAPVLTPLLTSMAEWIARNRELIAINIAGWSEQLLGWLVQIKDTLFALGDAAFSAQQAMARWMSTIGAQITATFTTLWQAVRDDFLRDMRETGEWFGRIGESLASAGNLVRDAWRPVAELFERIDRVIAPWRGQGRVIPMPGLPALPSTPGGPGPLSGQRGYMDRLNRFLPPLFGVPDSPVRPQSYSPANDGGGRLAISVRFDNAPPGMRADVDAREAPRTSPTLDVGYARLGARRA